jgi:hypothetical protein
MALFSVLFLIKKPNKSIDEGRREEVHHLSLMMKSCRLAFLWKLLQWGREVIEESGIHGVKWGRVRDREDTIRLTTCNFNRKRGGIFS